MSKKNKNNDNNGILIDYVLSVYQADPVIGQELMNLNAHLLNDKEDKNEKNTNKC